MSEMIRLPSRITIQRQTFRCMKCRVRFEQEMAVNVPVDVYVAQAKTMHCPGCGAGWKTISMGEARTLEEDIPDRLEHGSIAVRAENWRVRGERGQSADAMCCHMLHSGMFLGSEAHPHDMDDFRRCVLLLGHVPEWETDIGDMASLSPTWSRLASAWQEVTRLYREEAPNCDRSAPRAGNALAAALAELQVPA